MKLDALIQRLVETQLLYPDCDEVRVLIDGDYFDQVSGVIVSVAEYITIIEVGRRLTRGEPT